MIKYTGRKSAAALIEKLLAIAWYLGFVVGGLLLVGQIFILTAAPAWIGETMTVQIETPGLLFNFSEEAIITGSDLLFNYQLAMIVPFLAIGLLIIYNLRKIFATIVAENPFTEENSRRIKVIGWAIIAASILKGLVAFLLGLYFSNMISLPGLELRANLRMEDFGGVFVGLIVLILAEVFMHGFRLQEEQNLTV